MFVPDQQALRGTPVTMSWQALDSDGAATSPVGAVTVSVARADGTSVLPAGTATVGSGAAPRTVALSAAQTAALDWLTATWTDNGLVVATTTLEVVGGYFVSIAEIRAFNNGELSDVGKYPTSMLVARRREVEAEWEEIADVAFVPRYRRDFVQRSVWCGFLLPRAFPRAIRSVRVLDYNNSLVGTPFTVDQLSGLVMQPSGVVVATGGGLFPAGRENIIVEWEHGYDRLPPDLKADALRFLRYRLNKPSSGVPDRAERYQATDGITVGIASPSFAKLGFPEIDAKLSRYSMRTPVLA
jgi:hypothetical protein